MATEGTPRSPHMSLVETDAAAKAAFRSARFDDALRLYSDAINLCVRSSDPAHRRELPRLYANRAAAHSQLRNLSEVVADCTLCLELDPDHLKALVRRGTALLAMEMVRRSVADLNRACAIVTSSPELAGSAFARQVYASATEASKLLASLASDKDVDSDIADISKGSLRLYFQRPVPTRLALNRPHRVSVYVSNEFGLHRRSSPDDELAEVRVVLEPVPGRGPSATACPLTLDVVAADGGPSTDCPVMDAGGKASFYVSVSGVPDGPVLLYVTLPDPGVLGVASLPISFYSDEGDGSGDGETVSSSAPTAALDSIHTGASVRLINAPGDVTVALMESQAYLGIGGKLWDGGLVLLQYVAANPDVVAGKHVLEVGAGTGVVGLGCGAFGAHKVTISDLPEVLPLLDANISLNTAAPRCTAVSLPWGDASAAAAAVSPDSPVDVVLGADVVYDPELYTPLISTLKAVCTPATRVLLGYRHRHPQSHEFWEKLEDSFDKTEVDLSGLALPTDGCRDVVLWDIKLKPS